GVHVHLGYQGLKDPYNPTDCSERMRMLTPHNGSPPADPPRSTVLSRHSLVYARDKLRTLHRSRIVHQSHPAAPSRYKDTYLSLKLKVSLPYRTDSSRASGQ